MRSALKLGSLLWTRLNVGMILICSAGCMDMQPPLQMETPPASEQPQPDLGADLMPPQVMPPDPNLQYNELWLQKSATDFSAWTQSGVAVTPVGEGGAGAKVELAPSRGGALTCASDDIDGGAASFDATAGLCAGTDPMPAGLPAGVTYYNGGSFYYGTLRSPEVTTRLPIDHLIASWNASTPAGTWLEIRVRAKIDGSWSSWYRLPVWSSDPATVKRHSIKVAADDTGLVDTDTFALRNGKKAASYQLGVTLFSAKAEVSPSLRLISAVASRDLTGYPNPPADQSVWGTILPVPGRSQELPEYKKPEYAQYGGGGEVWCSPTSTSMVMAYWSHMLGEGQLNQTVPDAAAGCYDWVYQGTGNWPFNTAYAANFGLIGYVTRLYSFSQAEAWIKRGVPIIISIAFKAGELPGAPISKTNGHLIVVRGFDRSGDVLVNDPAARDDASVQLLYPRLALEAAWAHSHRTAYILYPPSWTPGPY